jgi:PAS domain S-box-containing protein
MSIRERAPDSEQPDAIDPASVTAVGSTSPSQGPLLTIPAADYDALLVRLGDAERQRRTYEAILANTPDLAYVFDLKHRFIYANPMLLRIWGRSWNDAIGKTCLEIGYEPWHARMHDDDIEQVVLTRQPVRGEVPFTGTSGVRDYDYIFVPVFDQTGAVVAVAGTTRDITEKKRHERELQTLADRLAEADRRKTEFIAILAHELRNPLSPILNGVTIIQQADGDRFSRLSAASMIERQVQHMVRLVDDLLDLSRISRGTIELRNEVLDIEHVVTLALEAVSPSITALSQHVTVQNDGAQYRILGDRVRMVQVFANILTNASKFSPGGSDIDIRVSRRDDQVVVCVRDHGMGVPQDMLNNVFDMFTQVDRSIHRAKGGLGIGLTLVKTMVVLHGGSVEARSEGTGHGTELSVSLPIAEVALAAERAARIPPSAPGAPVRIAVVDDNRDSAVSLAVLLRLSGHETAIAYDGDAALATIREFDPDVVFLDIGLPRMNGYEVCRQVRRISRARPVIVIALTGWGQEEDRRRSFDAGFDAHLVKPVDPETLIRTLSQLTRSLDRAGG